MPQVEGESLRRVKEKDFSPGRVSPRLKQFLMNPPEIELCLLALSSPTFTAGVGAGAGIAIYSFALGVSGSNAPRPLVFSPGLHWA